MENVGRHVETIREVGKKAAALLEELPRLVARAPLETVALPNLGLGRHPFVDEQAPHGRFWMGFSEMITQ